MHHRLTCCLFVAILAATGCGPTGSAPRDLLLRAAELPYPAAYRFQEIPVESALQECLNIQHPVEGIVDSDRAIAAIGRDADSSPEIIWTAERVYIRAVEVTDQPLRKWVTIDRGAALSGQRKALAEAIGASLVPYVGGTPPPWPRDVALAVVEDRSATLSMNRSGSVTAAVGEGTLTQTENASPLRGDLQMEFEFDGSGRIDKIAVRQQADAVRLQFDWSSSTSSIRVPSTADTVDAADIDLTTIRRARGPSQCAIGA